jgi:hypothetical protein
MPAGSPATVGGDLGLAHLSCGQQRVPPQEGSRPTAEAHLLLCQELDFSDSFQQSPMIRITIHDLLFRIW